MKGLSLLEYLETRKEIATALNFGKYPVLTMDLADTDEYGLKGCIVRLRGEDYDDGSPNYRRAMLRGYADKTTFSFINSPERLSTGFTYRDMKEMMDYANAPVLTGNCEFVLVVYDSRDKSTMYKPMILHTGKYDGVFYGRMKVVDDDYSTIPLLTAAGVNIERWVALDELYEMEEQ